MIDRSQVHEGMVVRTSDGKKLGRVLACEEGRFIVEKGFFFATDYVARYDDVSSVSGDEIRLARPQDALEREHHVALHEGGLGESFTVGLGAGVESSPADSRARTDDEEERVRRGGTRTEDREGPSYNFGEDPGAVPPTYGDEGGGGLP